MEELLRSPRVSYEPLRQPALLPFEVDRAAADDEDGDERFGRRLLELRWSVIEQQAKDDSYHAMLNSQLQVLKIPFSLIKNRVPVSICYLLSRFSKENRSCKRRLVSWN